MTDMTPELQAALDQLAKAVRDEGPHPEYHRAVYGRVKQEWPSLIRAVEAVLKAQR